MKAATLGSLRKRTQNSSAGQVQGTREKEELGGKVMGLDPDSF